MLCLALAGLFLAIERLLQKPQAELTGLDRMIGYLLLGRFFPRLRARAQAQGQFLSPRLKRLLLAVLAIAGIIGYLVS